VVFDKKKLRIFLHKLHIINLKSHGRYAHYTFCTVPTVRTLRADLYVLVDFWLVGHVVHEIERYFAPAPR
jgi:hypothetical protein